VIGVIGRVARAITTMTGQDYKDPEVYNEAAKAVIAIVKEHDPEILRWKQAADREHKRDFGE